MVKKVAIFGDSWAVGSYTKLSNMTDRLDGVTFQSLFSEYGITARNFSIPGGTNLDTLEQLVQINKRNSKDYDLAIVFQTDPIRQYLERRELVIKQDVILPGATNFVELCETTLKNFYNDVSKSLIPVLLIGGCTKLCFKYVPNTIKTLPKSWTELMVPDFVDSYYYWLEPSLLLYKHALNTLKWNLALSDFFEYEKEITTKNDIWQTSENFSWCHAAQPAYKKMFETIMEVI